MGQLDEVQLNEKRVGAVVVAAGASQRMQGVDKIFYPLDGMPLIWHSISALLEHPSISDIVLVTSKGNIARAEELVACESSAGSVTVREGGERRQDSVLRGLDSLDDCELVVVHDGARPFISPDLLDRGISGALRDGAAIAAVPVKDTIKMSDSEDMVTQTIPRGRLWTVQTPQVFKTSLLEEAHRQVSEMVTDDASMVEAIGHPVRLFLGSYYNIKVTTPEDLTIANAIVNLRNGDARSMQ